MIGGGTGSLWQSPLKQIGTNLSHSFGHGQDTLSTVLVTRNRLAFAMHGRCDMAQDLWQQARTVVGTRKAMVQHIPIITRYHLFGNWTEMLLVMAGRKAVPARPYTTAPIAISKTGTTADRTRKMP